MKPVQLTETAFADRCEAATCRACGQRGLAPVLDLGTMPLTAAFRTVKQCEQPEKRYPLELAFCKQCTLVQILETVPREEMFRSDYPYFSSFSESWARHCRLLVSELIQRRQLRSDSFVVEVASNDGCLLRNCVDYGIPCLGIDPAAGPAEAARRVGVATEIAFFDAALARSLRSRRAADVIIANNVLAHVAALHSFVEGLRILLADDGLFVAEFPYVRDLVERCEFDTIYHEHLCYYSLTSVRGLLAQHGLFVNDAQRLPSHGGSLRIYAEAQDRPEERVLRLLQEEQVLGMGGHAYYQALRARTEDLRARLRALLAELRDAGKRIVAYGAAAKGVILLNYLGLEPGTIEWVVDLNVHKQGLCVPGLNLPVYAPARLLEERPDYVLLLPWNLSEEIIEQQAPYRAAGGMFIIPNPALKIV